MEGPSDVLSQKCWEPVHNVRVVVHEIEPDESPEIHLVTS